MQGELLKTTTATAKPRYLVKYQNKLYSRPRCYDKLIQFRCFNQKSGQYQQNKQQNQNICPQNKHHTKTQSQSAKKKKNTQKQT